MHRNTRLTFILLFIISIIAALSWHYFLTALHRYFGALGHLFSWGITFGIMITTMLTFYPDPPENSKFNDTISSYTKAVADLRK